MKVYAELQDNGISKGIARVRDALKRYAPDDIEFVGDKKDADLIIYHVVGVQNLMPIPIDRQIAEDGKPYAMLQYVWKTTENGGDPAFWGPLWGRAECVWSYYDLYAPHRDCPGFDTRDMFEFYYAPLGVDPIFRKLPNVPKLFTIGTSGYIAEDEGVREAAAAAQAIAGGYHFHLGPDFGLGIHSCNQVNLTDEQVVRRWNECHYVAGLRRVEGFELPAAEAACCGTRPVVFAAPHYRAWFTGIAEFVPEQSEDALRADLTHLLSQINPMTDDEIAIARRRFDWDVLVKEFFRRLQ